MTELLSRVWLWCHNTGAYNNNKALKAQSDYTPVEAAAYLGVKNVLMVVYGGNPIPPFDAQQRKFSHLDKVVWSIIGDSSSKRNREKTDLDDVLRLHDSYPNVAGGIMDDFFGINFPIERLRNISETMHAATLPLWVVLYSHELEKAEELGLAEKLPLCDVITFWTWHARDLKHLTENMRRAREIAPGKRFVLGCYLWDFGAAGTISSADMMFQLEHARTWLLDGTIHDMILLGSPLFGMNLETIKLAKEWLSQHAHDVIPD